MTPHRKQMLLALGLAFAVSLFGCVQSHAAPRHHHKTHASRFVPHHHHARRHHRHHTYARRHHHRRFYFDASGGQVCSKSGVCKHAAANARSALQCVVNYVEGRGVRIVSMRICGEGTVRHSLHPFCRALDINQTDRDVTHPNVPRAVSNAAADHCGVVSGARWGYADNGHWNLRMEGRATQEPWPRVLQKTSNE